MNTEVSPPIEILPDQLSEDALRGVIDAFIMREGTDYGVTEVSHSTKVEQIRRQLLRGDIKIIFDPNSESVTMVTSRDWAKIRGPTETR